MENKTPNEQKQTAPVQEQTPVIKQETFNAEIVKSSDLPVTDYFNPIVWQQMKGMAETFSKSGALSQTENTATLLMKLQAGREMGMKPVESIKSFYFVNGSINIYGAALIRRFREHGWSISYKDEEGKCTAIVKKNGETITETFTFEEAEKSGWTKSSHGVKPGWIVGINRRLKLRYGALSVILRTYLPELLGSATDIAEIAIDSTQVTGKDEIVPEIESPDEPATKTQIDALKVINPELFDTKGELKAPLTRQEVVKLMKEGSK